MRTLNKFILGSFLIIFNGCATFTSEIAYNASKGIIEAFSDGGEKSKDKDAMIAKYGIPNVVRGDDAGVAMPGDKVWIYNQKHAKCAEEMCYLVFDEKGKMYINHGFYQEI